MQAVPISWLTDALALSLRPVRLHLVADRFGESLERCQRCDILLGSQPCPNPLCREQHGQSTGDLCAWCRHNYKERTDGIDIARLHDRTFKVL
jgi:hypothetical protein